MSDHSVQYQTQISAVYWCHNTWFLCDKVLQILNFAHKRNVACCFKTITNYTAISSPKQSGRFSAFSTFKSLAASAPTPSACPQLSRSSLSSVFDSYSDPIPDSLNRSSSRAPRTCSPSSELSSLGVSPVSWPCSWLSGAREEKRKHSSRTPLPPSPWGLMSVPVVPGEQGRGRAETQAPSLIWSRDWVAKALIDEEEVSGSRGVLGCLVRKVISRRLSWEPTKNRDNIKRKMCRWNKAQR